MINIPYVAMNKLTINIDKQIEFNRDKNILADNLESFQFIAETLNAIAEVNQIHVASEQFLIEYAIDKAIQGFCRVNQYYSFDSGSKEELRKIYTDLFKDIRTNSDTIENISKNHYEKLKNWLKASNPFAEKIYPATAEKLKPVACAEYSPELQCNILHLDINCLNQPVLDIGCGSRKLSYVFHLKQRV
ncbi:MAG: hypothetical protein HC906_10785 [Bacteroidales bacterium]|nr:hypothetical protein [Bacteroidales bacterium]